MGAVSEQGPRSKSSTARSSVLVPVLPFAVLLAVGCASTGSSDETSPPGETKPSGGETKQEHRPVAEGRQMHEDEPEAVEYLTINKSETSRVDDLRVTLKDVKLLPDCSNYRTDGYVSIEVEKADRKVEVDLGGRHATTTVVCAHIFSLAECSRDSATLGVVKATTSEAVARGTLRMGDSEFFEPMEHLLGRLRDRLLNRREDFLGVALSAPVRLGIADRAELPLVVAMRRTGLRAWEVMRNSNTALAAMNVDTREVFLGKIFRDPEGITRERHEPERSPRPEGDSAGGILVEAHRFDARALLRLPWKASRLRFVVIHYDWISNVVDVELVGSGPPEAGRVRGVCPLPPAPAEVATGSRLLPTYLPFAGAPTLESEKPSIALSSGPRPGSGTMLSGSFAVTADAAHVPNGLIEVTEVGAVRQSVAAVVPITLAVVGLDWDVPKRIELAVPVYGPRPAQPGSSLTGHFKLDLLQVLPRLGPGSHLVYAFLEGRIFGPWTFARP